MVDRKRTDREYKGITSPPTGRKDYSDGDGLYLRVKATGSKTWVFKFAPPRPDGTRRCAGDPNAKRKTHEMGLGVFGDQPGQVGVAEARRKARDARSRLDRQENPLKTERAEAAPTFGELADKVVKKVGRDFRNEKHKAQWSYTLDKLGKKLRDRPVNEIEPKHVLEVLEPIWTTKPETASRLRGRIERVLDEARVGGHIRGPWENPARWQGNLKLVLGARRKLTRGHHAALAWREAPLFMRRLRDCEGVGARALEFAILTAVRTGEVLGAQWPEFDLKEKVWTVPGERMKAGRDHRVPLCARAVEIIEEMQKLRRADHVFPGAARGKPLSNMSLTAVIKRLNEAAAKAEPQAEGPRCRFQEGCSHAAMV